MKPTKFETTVHGCHLAWVTRLCACVRWRPHHNAGATDVHVDFSLFSFSLTKYSSTLLTDEESFLRNWNVPAFSSCNRDRKFYLLPRKIFLLLLNIQPMAASIFSRSNEGLTLESRWKFDLCQFVWHQILVFHFSTDATPQFHKKLAFHLFYSKSQSESITQNSTWH